MSKRRFGALTLILLGFVLGGIVQPFQWLPTFAAGSCRTFTETGKQVCGRFLDYWTKNGGLAQQGLPLTNEFTEVSDLNGQSYTVQYFERAVFEMHPENKAPYDVLLSQLGTFRLKDKYAGNDPSGSGSGQPVATAVPSGGAKSVDFGTEVEFTQGHTLAWTDWQVTNCLGNNKNVQFYWVIEVRNPQEVPFDFQVYPGDLHVKDSLGNTLPLYEPNGPQLQSIPAHSQTQLFIQTSCGQVFAGTKYVELTIDKISNAVGPFTLRRYIGN